MPGFIQVVLAPPPPPVPNPIPIDGGLGFLIAAGMVYGAKKLYDNKDRQK